MGLTLDQLLDETGAAELGGSGVRHTKTASTRHDFAKLADRCRRAAEVTPDETAIAGQHALAEKTAAVAVISRTIAEIRAIDGDDTPLEKTAAAQSSIDLATFIKTALDAGHDPSRIAEFLEKQGAPGGLIDRALGRVHEFRAGHAVRKAERLAGKSSAAEGKAFRLWEDRVRKAEPLGDAHRDAVLSRMRVELGDERTAKLVHGNKAFSKLPSYDGLRAPADAGTAAGGAQAVKPLAAGVTLGGKQMGVTSEQLGKLKKPAMYLGAGVLAHKALSKGGDDGDSKKRGVVVVNS